MSLDLSQLGVHELINREWLASNHIGGYASQTVLGLNSRKYHGLLVASMSPPLRRMVILSRVEDFVKIGSRTESLSSSEYPGVIHPNGRSALKAFSASPYPRWAYQGDGWTIEKNVRLLDGQNTVVLSYTLLTGERTIELEVRPLLALRGIHEMMFQGNGRLKSDQPGAQSIHIAATRNTPEVFLCHDGVFDSQPNWYLATIYRREIERGYGGLEDVWMPGPIRWKLEPGRSVHLVCSTEPIHFDRALSKADEIDHIEPRAISNGKKSFEPIQVNDEALQTLLAAADQFEAKAADGSTVAMCGFPWPAVSGRDELLGISGIFLIPKKFDQAKSLLLSMFDQTRGGLAPSEFPEDRSAPLFQSADASLWLINAIAAYAKYTNDDQTVGEQLLPALLSIVKRYRSGIALGIECDADGLLSSRQPGIATSWMNAKIADWVITPRAGRPVELNALWYNALRIAQDLSERFGRPADGRECGNLALLVENAFNRRFWNAEHGCCYDVITDNGADASIRPNQLLAISLPYPVLNPLHWHDTLKRVEQSLLTPFGLRSLAPTDPGYEGRYQGDVVSRDRAYHQGSVYPWLLGPYVSALVRANGQSQSAKSQARHCLSSCLRYMQTDGLGQIPELFDGDGPHRPGGAIASVRSVAEILRCYVEDILDPAPPRLPNSEKTPQLMP